MRARLAITLVLVLAISALIGVELAGAGAPAPAIRIGIASRPVHELVQLASEKGLFAREGARVEIVEFPESSDARRAYERGQIDGLAGTLVDLALLRRAGARAPVGFAVLGTSRGADALIARPAVAAVSDLRGRRVGIGNGTSAMLVLASAGLGLGDVTPVPVDHECGPHALADGRVDAVVSSPRRPSRSRGAAPATFCSRARRCRRASPRSS